MLRIIVITLTFAVLWSMRWFWLAGSNQDKIEQFIRAEATDVAYSDISQSGFPNRYDVTIRDLSISENGAEVFSSSIVQIMRLAYREDHFVAAFSNNVGILGQQVSAEQNRASIVKQQNDVTRIVWEAKGIELKGATSIEHAQVAIVILPDSNEIDTYIQLEEVAHNGVIQHDTLRLKIKASLSSRPDLSTLRSAFHTINSQLTDLKITDPDMPQHTVVVADIAELMKLADDFPLINVVSN